MQSVKKYNKNMIKYLVESNKIPNFGNNKPKILNIFLS
ncbi:hypothetical protein HMPREF9296_2344 [Prevotella disiens FB035-09AN]|uniref:Uncharacterized protein n=1 Tax=Prevotella disiens FB035-09AN TaxID=866771 RepID=E1KRE5_9BACT|nr:hypothetical protein HMPREF9296_2344 [Prevotella disiens FB035-09AN]